MHVDLTHKCLLWFTAFMCSYLEFKLKLKSVVFLIASGTCLNDFVAFLDEIVDSSDEEETDGNYTLV